VVLPVGINFMNCWSTGYVAGEFSVEQLLESIKESKGADWKFNRASEKRGGGGKHLNFFIPIASS
jgi:hypothetical protein